ncbi:MAG: DUF4149 domain-containing protein [Alphaproteobacteria bacterium]
MVFFAPTVFRSLPRDVASDFMRALFPKYFSVMGILSLLPLLVLLPVPAYRPEGYAMLAVAALFFGAWGILLPALQRQRDAGNDRMAAGLHRASVLIHLAQWVTAGVVLVRLAA